MKDEETRVALVDLYSTTQHSVKHYEKYGLYVAAVLDEPVIYGAVLPMGSETARNCFRGYTENHQLEIHEIIEKFIKTEKVREYAILSKAAGTLGERSVH